MKTGLRNGGLTLIELVLAIAVAGIALSALLKSFGSIVLHSADPMITQQSIAIAESFMEEVMAMPYLDPATGTVCPTAPLNRASYNNVCDYHAYSSASISDIAGNVLGLSGYQVSITVINGSAVNGHLGAVSGDDLLQINILVSNPLQESVALSAYRVHY